MDWPHAPVHRLGHGGAFIVTCGTYLKEHHFRGRDRLALLHDTLISLADRHEWRLQAWAVFSNHYHFIATSPDDASNLPRFISHLHTATSSAVNKLDNTPGRKVWHQYRETGLTYEKSYLARLKYVANNPVHHGIVLVATQYPWCSAAWFERTADTAFFKTVDSFKVDRVNVDDDFQPGHEC